MTADQERAAIGEHREYDCYHYLSSYSLAQIQLRSKLLIPRVHRLLMTDRDSEPAGAIR